MIYLVHFYRPFGHARHYVGWCDDARLNARMDHHAAGSGATLMRHVSAANIPWAVVRTFPGATRTDERRFKNGGHTARYCPVCRTRPYDFRYTTPDTQKGTDEHLPPTTEPARATLRPSPSGDRDSRQA